MGFKLSAPKVKLPKLNVGKVVKNVTNTVVKANVDAAKALKIDTALQKGAPIAAGFLAGPAGAAVASQGGNQMDFLSQINGFLGGDSALSQLANSSISGLIGGKPKPVVQSSISTPTVISAPAPQSSFDFKKWGLIGGGVAVVLVILAVILKRK